MDTQLRLTLTLTVLLVGCSQSDSTAPSASTRQAATQNQSQGPESMGGLRVQFAGTPLADAKQAIVLLHGYGAAGDDLVSLAGHIGGESRAFVFPEGPFPLRGGGKAWATNDEELNTSRSRVIDLLNEIVKAHPDIRISVGGFSQGATIATTLLTDDRLQIEHLLLYSPAFKLDDDMPAATHPTRILISHGRVDAMLPFADSERLRDLLMRKGYDVNWQPFAGGHTLTPELMVATRKQLDGVTK